MQRIRSYALATTFLALAGTASAQSDRLEGLTVGARGPTRAPEAAPDAPTAGDEGDWANRSKLWEAVLSEHAKKGYLEMPARGGAEDASDYEVQAAAEYMLTISHPDLPHD